MGDWHIRLKSSERVLTDVLDKTGAKMIRPKFINELKEISQTHMMNFEVKSPEGLNKLSSRFVLVEYATTDNQVHNVTGLFEYAYGALRLVAVDDEKLANASGDDIIAFFETPLQKKTKTSIHVYEAKKK